MDTDTTPRPVVTVVPKWADLTTAERFQYAGNTDPWAGPVDPEAVAPQLRRARHQSHGEPGDACGCWASDCAECGPRRADGQRPRKGHTKAWALRQDAALQGAKESAR